MCRCDIAVDAAAPLADLLRQMAQSLATEHGVPIELVKVGPVDFGESSNAKDESDV